MQWKRSTRLEELLETIFTHIFIPPARERDETRESKVSDTIRLITGGSVVSLHFFLFFFFFQIRINIAKNEELRRRRKRIVEVERKR